MGRHLLGLVLGASLLGACGDGEDAEPEATFSAVSASVITISGCGSGLCHAAAALGGFAVGNSKDELHAALVDQPATGRDCASSGLVRVVPGKPNESLLYLKIESDSPPCGDEMPVGAPLDAAEIDLVRRWIEAGAKNN